MEKSKGKKIIKGIFITFLVLVLVGGIGGGLWYLVEQKSHANTAGTADTAGAGSVEVMAQGEPRESADGAEPAENEGKGGTLKESESADTPESAIVESKETSESRETLESGETSESEEALESGEISESKETVESEEDVKESVETENDAETDTAETEDAKMQDAESESGSIESAESADSQENDNDESLWVSSNTRSFRAPNQMTGYERIMQDYGLPQDQGPAIEACFERLVFEGTNKDKVDWLNNQILALEDAYKAQVEAADLPMKQQELAEAGFSGALQYVPKTVESVYYGEGENISISYSWCWYEDGIENQCWDTLNVNLDTRKNIPLQEVLGVTLEEVKEQVITAVQEQCGVSRNRVKDIIYGMETFSYYFDADAVILCFDSYELGLAASSQQVVLPRNNP